MTSQHHVLMFDVPRNLNTVEKKINRRLHKMRAKMMQHSVWKHHSIKDLIDVAMEIKNSGGKAVILEERLVFQ